MAINNKYRRRHRGLSYLRAHRRRLESCSGADVRPALQALLYLEDADEEFVARTRWPRTVAGLI
jgi:hypothetical protein